MFKSGILLVALSIQVYLTCSTPQYGPAPPPAPPGHGYGNNYQEAEQYDCNYSPRCNPYYPWRLVDGSCNNLNITLWGASMQAYKRLLPPAYNDGKQAPRSHSVKDYSPLNSPRDIANKVHYPYDYQSRLTNLFVVFGQIVMHDLSSIYIQHGPYGQTLPCSCDSPNPNCLKIPIPKDDYYFKNQYCMVQIRSKAAKNCEKHDYPPAREILNKINSWVDLSFVYGNNAEEENNLRTFYGGKLRVSYFKGSAGPLLPSECPASTFHMVRKTNVCFHAGDDRVNQYPTLTSLHTIFLREHNRIAEELYKINPHWNEEKLYEETKRILNAIYQNIVYWEWLPLLIGRDIHKIFDLDNRPYGVYFDNYDPYVNPNVAIEFSAAAARYGHAQTRPYASRANADYETTYNYTVREMMFKPNHVVPNYNVDQYVLGMIKDAGYDNAPHVNNELMNWLIVDHGNANPSKFYSLPALNINRGREVGLAPYVYYRKLAGLNVPYSFDELTGIKPEIVDRLKQVYKHVEDIDLYTGASSEMPVEGGVVGPTFAYILASGFRDWKYGDRWWFENSPRTTPYAFTLPQLDSIRKVRFNSIVCNNVYAKHVPYNVFTKADPGYNKFIPCDKVYQLDLSMFREQPRSYKKRSYSPY